MTGPTLAERAMKLAGALSRAVLPTFVVAAALTLTLAPALPANAQAPASGELTATERQIVALMRLNDAFDAYWMRHVQRVVIAAEEFRRAALLRRCEVIRRHPAPFLEPRYRAAIEQVAANRQREAERFAGPTMTRWQHRAALHALGRMPPADAERLLAGIGTPAFERVSKLLAHETVLGDYQGKAVDVTTGRDEPAAAVWLKAYFARAGDGPLLRRALASRRPDLLGAFDRVGSFDKHSPADAEWLGALTKELVTAAPDLASEIAATLPAELEPTDTLLRGYIGRVAEAHVRTTAPPGFGRPLAPGVDPETESIAARFPPPEGLMEGLMRIGPTQVAGAEVERFCPR
jgi:hypothetical protein